MLQLGELRPGRVDVYMRNVCGMLCGGNDSNGVTVAAIDRVRFARRER